MLECSRKKQHVKVLRVIHVVHMHSMPEPKLLRARQDEVEAEAISAVEELSKAGQNYRQVEVADQRIVEAVALLEPGKDAAAGPSVVQLQLPP